MQRFTQLYFQLDATNRTSQKLAALENYFSQAPPQDAAWALAILSGTKLIRAVSSTRLRNWAAQESGYPPWLIDESYDSVGDLAETLALILPEAQKGFDEPLHTLLEHRVLPLPKLSEQDQRKMIIDAWRTLNTQQRFIFHKMIMGSLRVGVASKLVVRALANVAGVDPAIIAHRLTGRWEPTPENYRALMQTEGREIETARPYPFCLAYPLDVPIDSLGPAEDWQAEWKWDGIRAQLIHRENEVLIWSRGEEVITPAFPEIQQVGQALPPGTVLDGEILAWEFDRPLPFILLQRRINRKREQPRLWDEVPIIYMAFDVLELDRQDIRHLPLSERRSRLENVISSITHLQHIQTSPLVPISTWEELHHAHQQARDEGAEGLMLKRRSSHYGVGRQRGDWWKWKVAPYTIDAVLIYAQLGTGKRASLFTDYTFGVWNAGELVPVAKAYSGLTDEEIRQVDAFIRKNTLERAGPVRIVRPELVFELAFEAIQPSTRHRSGLAVRFPRINRWRHDKKAKDADTLEALRALMQPVSS